MNTNRKTECGIMAVKLTFHSDGSLEVWTGAPKMPTDDYAYAVTRAVQSVATQAVGIFLNAIQTGNIAVCDALTRKLDQTMLLRLFNQAPGIEVLQAIGELEQTIRDGNVIEA